MRTRHEPAYLEVPAIGKAREDGDAREASEKLSIAPHLHIIGDLDPNRVANFPIKKLFSVDARRRLHAERSTIDKFRFSELFLNTAYNERSVFVVTPLVPNLT